MNHTLSVALIQAELAWEDPGANREYFYNTLKELPENTQVAVMPEMFTSGFTMNPTHLDPAESETTRQWMQDCAREFGLLLIGSTVFTEAGKHYNRLFAAFPDGKLLKYDKRHTFTLAGEDQVYEAGKEKLVFDYAGFRICPQVCYDLRFPVWNRNTEDYDLLIFVANWPSPRVDAWDTLLRARAIENMAYVAGVNRVGKDGTGHLYPGHTAAYDMLGKPLGLSRIPETLLFELDKKTLMETRERFKFLQDRDHFSIS